MKHLLHYLLAVLFVFAVPQLSMADTWDGSAVSWTNGSGTAADPYLIECAAHLAYLQEMVNGGVSTYSGQYFKLTTDIDLNSISWLGIGTSETLSFQGIFDGDNHSITSVSSSSALFNYVKNFTLKNLSTAGNAISGIIQNSYGTTTVDNCHNAVAATSSAISGGIVGNAFNACSITNCSNVGNITGSTAGGIIGSARSCTITNCYNSGSIRGYMFIGGKCVAGGIVGSGAGTITNCYNMGSVTMSSYNPSGSEYSSFNYRAGGIVGESESNGIITIKRCHNSGSVSTPTGTTTYSFSRAFTGTYQLYSFAGGIVGYATANCNISLCYNKAVCYSSSNFVIKNSASYKCTAKSYAYSGGIMGYSSGSSSVTNCYNNCDSITSTATAESYYSPSYARYQAGEAMVSYSAGISYGSNVTNTNCYNTGKLYAYAGSKYGISTGTATNCYYLSTCGGSGNGTSKTEAIMKSTSMPVLLNSEDEVYIMDITPNVNDGYPIFGSSVCDVVTNDATNIGFHTATINGNYTSGTYWPGGSADVQGFIRKIGSASVWDTVYTDIGTPFSYNMTNLTPGTTYKYRAFVTKSGVTFYGEEKSFTTIDCNTLTASIDTSTLEMCAGDTTTLTASGASDYSENFTYQWNTEATTAVIRPTESGTYTVTVTDDNGCTATDSVTLTVNPLPVGTISGRASICSGNSTTLTASGANSYTWSTGATTPTLTTSTAGTYTCTFRNSYGCTSTQDVTISVFAAPVISGTTAICSGNSTTLTASGADSYTWSTGATTPSITITEAGTYTVTGSTSDGCSGSAGVTVSVGALPTITIGGNTSFCQGASTTLTAMGGDSYEWNNGTTGSTLTVSSPGTYTVTGTNASGCSNTASIQVTTKPSYVNLPVSAAICQGASYNAMGQTFSTAGNYHIEGYTTEGCDSIIDLTLTVNQLPTPTITGNTNICEGVSTTLAALGGTSFLWNNGSTSQSINVSNAGVYSVTVTDINGCSNSTSATVSVNTRPTVTISGSTAICAGNSTTLTAQGADSYLWNNGSNGQSITVTNAGTYTVTGTSANGCDNTTAVTVTVNPVYTNVPIAQAICEGSSYNFFGTLLTTAGSYSHNGTSLAGCDSVVSLTLTVNPLPTATISGNTTFCEGQNTSLTASGGASYLWNNGATTQNITVSNGGAYSVTVTDANGCSNTTSTTVTVNSLPNITISGNTSFCQGGSTTLQANGADNYMWSTGSSNASIQTYNAGIYTVTGTNANGCSNSATVTVSVNPVYNIPVAESLCQGNSYNFFGQSLTTGGTYSHTLQTPAGCDSVINLTLTVNPLPMATISGNTTFCEGQNTSLTASGGASYLWNNGATTQNITVSNGGAYSVTVTDANGCSNTTSTTVTVNSLPNITISGNTAFCEGSNTTLTAQGGNSYVWSNGSQAASISVSTSGNYTVTGSGTNGCTNTASVTVMAEPTPTITVSGNTSFYQGGSTTLTASGADSYTWSNGTTTPSVTIDAFGVYNVTGTTAAGCTGSASVTVTVSPNPTITITGDTELCPGETTTLTASGGTSYMWFDGTTSATYQTGTAGSYTVIGYNDAGCYSMVSVDVQQYDNAQSEETATGYGEYVWNGNVYTESGDYTFETVTEHGCDSTVTLHLTIEENGQGIDDVAADNVKIYSRNSEIVIEGVEGEDALVYDVTGRVMHRGRVEGPIRVGAMGVYMVKVGERQPRKVVVR